MSSLVDQERYAAIQTRLRGEAPDVVDPLASLSPADLRRLRSEIDRRLPEKKTLAEMDMPGELVEQFRKVKELQDDVLGDDEVPANQRAQVAGAVASTLQHLVKMQTDFYTSERFRNIENLMIKFMKKMPLETATEFLNEYEKIGEME